TESRFVRYCRNRDTKPKLNSLDEVDPELLKTFIPLTEQKCLSNVAIDAVLDSTSIAITHHLNLCTVTSKIHINFKLDHSSSYNFVILFSTKYENNHPLLQDNTYSRRCLYGLAHDFHRPLRNPARADLGFGQYLFDEVNWPLNGQCMPLFLPLDHNRGANHLSGRGDVDQEGFSISWRSGGNTTGCCSSTNKCSRTKTHHRPPSSKCAHPLNKRFHYSKTDKLGLFPRTKLFSPVGLFDLQITDDESDHNGRGRNTAAAISAAIDQIYNDMSIFNVESEAGGFFLENQLEVGNVVRNDVGENWLQVQNAHARVPCSNVLLRYYNILCGMGRKPKGHCDNFFIAGFCRKHFEDIHPRLSKKHFFYPKVGVIILQLFIWFFEDLRKSFLVEDLRKSFLGANSTLKLHHSNKLYFPVCHANHWFLFIVDLKNKRFVFMDSYFDEEDPFQCFVRDKLIRMFKVLWLLYSDSNIDVSSFKILYPAVPKQENTHDCGIFTLQYMEYWDIFVDMMLKIRTEDIPQIRITLAKDLYFSEKNTEDKSLVCNMFLQ
ncbi:hypothetical protein ACJX0J_033460, partial [Zea mays]